ncbi:MULTISPECIES: hypothetical protein [unclassified Mesorhizobium]|uniref:hypothetical protein n=1 Tax=unclassified Mesorhizobium TaxID=325217 RepID=UPI001129C63D|nr:MULTISPECIES: hypothetical protein [unclassified Mesorhizobium]MBZ9701781.1 hypothetical protein [Mesorhizobium sp. CO1-1-3]MBZ9949129.1 hypothetical protein [Mesorhizobium sp. BR1-1-11]TPI99666.1 hypothetical protein FJ428_22340 [Mesorhizobium sp. B2-8-1]
MTASLKCDGDAPVRACSERLSHVASHFPGGQHGSNCRRLQRFFQSIRLDQAVVAQLVVQMLNPSRPECWRSTAPTVLDACQDNSPIC